MRIIFILLLALLSSNAYNQNLVPNASFEDYVECPYATGDFRYVVLDWDVWSVTPDYFHVCGDSELGAATVPSNAWGYQYPVSGGAYAGIITYFSDSSPSFEDAREYIATELSEPMEPGVSYYVMAYISRMDGGVIPDWSCVVNNFGFKFYTEVPDYNEINPLMYPDNQPHFNYDQMIWEADGWLKIEGWFIADQAYEWVALGNFMDDDHTQIMPLGDPLRCQGYLYIDNVCISASEDSCDYLLDVPLAIQGSEFVVYPNPCHNYFQIKGRGFAELFDMKGALYSHRTLSGELEFWDVSALPVGVYVLRLMGEDKTILHRKIIIK